ncbi:hypothetical protein SY88_03310 [Clostridiales bacterium PH28_bin88]|nr:hypothetical protein SY88_03310 [Clostridiales bacterium PH28_bin88]
MLTDKELDRLITAAIREEIDGHEVPPEVKERVRKALGLNKRARVYSSFRVVALVAAVLSMMVLVSYFVLPTQATAISVKLVKRLEYLIQDRLYNISEGYSTQPESEPAPPQVPEVVIIKEEKVSLDEARTRLPFVLLVPKYVPVDSQLTTVTLSGSKPLMDVKLVYTGTAGTLMITESGVSNNLGLGIGYDADDTKVERVNIRGVQGNLLSNKSGQTVLIWHDQGVTYRILGPFPPEEIKKIAESLSS